jgi:hypothetical protein
MSATRCSARDDDVPTEIVLELSSKRCMIWLGNCMPKKVTDEDVLVAVWPSRAGITVRHRTDCHFITFSKPREKQLKLFKQADNRGEKIETFSEFLITAERAANKKAKELGWIK